MMHRIERTFAGRTLSIETGRMAKQAAGSALVTYGETMILAAVTVSDRKSPLPFFPLTVEYKEKTYAAGKIAGGFIKREGRPRDEEILSCRIIDRSIRPLFPEGFQNEVQVVLYVLSADQENDADVLGLLAASFALSASKIPFAGPIAGVRVGRVESKWLLNPTFQALEFSDIDMIVAGTADSIMMVEGGALEVSEEDVVEGLTIAQRGLKELVAMQEELLKKLKVEKMAWSGVEIPEDVRKTVTKAAQKRIDAAINQKDKATRIQAVEKVKGEVKDEMVAVLAPEQLAFVGTIVGDIEYTSLRAQVLDTGLRVDGRKPNVVRDISVDTSLLPRAHGSALFTRGQTQALVVATLGTASDSQRVDSIDSAKETTKSFMLHYNFPPFCTGEAKPMRGTGRREIGHGMLAERAIQGVLPPFEEFPYTIRIVSEVLESNGSSSMASVCGGSLACFDAGIPLKAPVAGVAMGLIKEGKKYAILTDILGTEDHLGDMDFKVAGTAEGITALQMDIKITGVTQQLLREALSQARDARLSILGKMTAALPAPRETLSEHAPQVVTVKIDSDQIGMIIGKGGETIRGLEEEFDCKIDIEEDGFVRIYASNTVNGNGCHDRIEEMTRPIGVGTVYRDRKVVKTADFGAFIELRKGTDGLLHASRISPGVRIDTVDQVLSRGDLVAVEVVEVDTERGRIGLKLVSKTEDGVEITPEQIGVRYKEQYPNAGQGGGGGADRPPRDGRGAGGGDRGERRGPRRPRGE